MLLRSVRDGSYKQNGLFKATKCEMVDALTRADLTEILPHKVLYRQRSLEDCQAKSCGNGDIFIKFTKSVDASCLKVVKQTEPECKRTNAGVRFTGRTGLHL